MMPVIPHLTNECLEKLKYEKKILWPEADKEYLLDKKVNIVIQINGKKRSILNINKDTEEKEILIEVNKQKLIDKYLDNNKVVKTIYIKNRLINYIIQK